MTSPALPRFKNPPLVEVVCGIQFAPLNGFKTVHVGEFWERIRPEYPVSEDRPILVQEVPERTVLELPPLRRVFFIDAAQDYLLQLQETKFLLNWRKVRASDSYPQFPTVFSRFRSVWRIFIEFLRERSIETPESGHLELTYVNHLSEVSQEFPAGMQEHFPLFSWQKAQTANFLPPPRAVAARVGFTMPNEQGNLEVSVKHGRRQIDNAAVMVLELTARSLLPIGMEALPDWFALAHEWVVRGFDDLTSESSHALWQRE